MNGKLKAWSFTAIAAMLISAGCSETKTSQKEEIEIKTMDSTSKAINENREKLEEHTKKLEQSLEKLDTEFDSTQN